MTKETQINFFSL